VQVIRLDAPEVRAKRRIGSMKGMFTLPEDFEEIDKQLDKEIERLMVGEEEK
jgi:hypothetical protein